MSSPGKQTQGNGGVVEAANETLDVHLQTYIETMKNNTRLAMKNITRPSLQKLLGKHHNVTAKLSSGSPEEALSPAPLNNHEARTQEQSLAGNETGFEENPNVEGYVIDTGVQGEEAALAGKETGLEANARFRADETGYPQGGGGWESKWSEDFEDEYEGAPFFNNLFNAQTLGAVQEKAKAHLVPQVQAFSQVSGVWGLGPANSASHSMISWASGSWVDWFLQIEQSLICETVEVTVPHGICIARGSIFGSSEGISLKKLLVTGKLDLG